MRLALANKTRTEVLSLQMLKEPAHGQHAPFPLFLLLWKRVGDEASIS